MTAYGVVTIALFILGILLFFFAVGTSIYSDAEAMILVALGLISILTPTIYKTIKSNNKLEGQKFLILIGIIVVLLIIWLFYYMILPGVYS